MRRGRWRASPAPPLSLFPRCLCARHKSACRLVNAGTEQGRECWGQHTWRQRLALLPRRTRAGQTPARSRRSGGRCPARSAWRPTPPHTCLTLRSGEGRRTSRWSGSLIRCPPRAPWPTTRPRRHGLGCHRSLQGWAGSRCSARTCRAGCCAPGTAGGQLAWAAARLGWSTLSRRLGRLRHPDTVLLCRRCLAGPARTPSRLPACCARPAPPPSTTTPPPWWPAASSCSPAATATATARCCPRRRGPAARLPADTRLAPEMRRLTLAAGQAAEAPRRPRCMGAPSRPWRHTR